MQLTLQGAGDTRRTMIVSLVLQWVFILPLAYLFGPKLGYGLLGIWFVQIFFRLVQAAIFVVLWKQGKWAEINV